MGLAKKTVFLVWIFAVMTFPFGVQAGSAFNMGHRSADNIFTKDRIAVQVVSGILNSPAGIGPDTVDFDYVQTNLRLGWMLNSPGPSEGFFRGNVEAVLEFTYSDIYSDYGDYFAGFTVLFKYNFVQPDAKFVPYVQAGAGLVFTDAYKDRTQRAIGNSHEFTPQASLGFRYLIDKNWSIDMEGMFEHISNANAGDRNVGANSLGGFVGITYFYNSLWK